MANNQSQMKSTKRSRKGCTWRYCNDCYKKHSGHHSCFPNRQMAQKTELDREISLTSEVNRYCKQIDKKFKQKNVKKSWKKRTGRMTDCNAESDKIINIIKPIKKDPLRTNPGECNICMVYKGYMLKLSCKHTICKDCYIKTLQSSNLDDKCGFCRTDMFSENWYNYLVVGNTKTNPVRVTKDGMFIPEPIRQRCVSLIKTDKYSLEFVANSIR